MRYEYPLAIKHSNGRFPIYRLLFPSKPPCLIPGGIWRVLFSDKTRSSLVSLMATCLKAAWLFEWKSGRLSTESSLSALRIFSPSNLRNKDFKKQKHEQASKIHLRVRKNIQISALTNMSPTFPYRKHLAFSASLSHSSPFIAIHRLTLPGSRDSTSWHIGLPHISIAGLWLRRSRCCHPPPAVARIGFSPKVWGKKPNTSWKMIWNYITAKLWL